MIEASASKSFTETKSGCRSSVAENPGSAGASTAVSRASRDIRGAADAGEPIGPRCRLFGGTPNAAGEVPAFTGRSRPLTWLNLLCLDAPLVAVSWQWLFARSFGIPLRSGAMWALLLTAWLIYLADRFGDSRSVDLAAPTSLRQRFCLRHRARWIAAVLFIGAADLFVICNWLDARQFIGGTAVGICAFAYLIVNQVVSSLWRVLPVKEISIGFLFAAGTTVAAGDSLTSAIAPACFLFACLCSLNCICIAVWERDLDMTQGRISIATAFPKIDGYVLPMLLSLMVASAALAAATPTTRSAYICITASASLLAVVHFVRNAIDPDTRTALADLVLLTPLIALPFAVA